jgi:predicted PurR-regulated permease PerM
VNIDDVRGADTADPSDDLVPGWLRRLAALGWRILAALALGLVLVGLAVLLSTVTAAIVVGLIVASTFAPYVQGLRARGWDRTKAAAAVSGVALLAIVVALVIIVLAFAPYVNDLLNAIRDGVTDIQTWLGSIGAPEELQRLIERAIGQLEDVLTSAAAGLIGPIAALVTVLILGGFLTFFLLLDGDRAWRAATGGMEPWRAEALTKRGRIAIERVGGYLRGTAILAGSDAVTDFIYLTILGVPLAAPLSVLVVLAGFVPYLGGFVATTVLVIVTWAFVGPTAVLILLALITITNIVQGNVIAPVVYGRTVEIHPALVLIALPAGAALFGVIGLFAALPVVAFVLAISPAIIEALDTAPGTVSEHGLVPTWLDRLGQWSWRGLVIVGLLFVAIQVAVAIPTVIVPVVLAIVLAATFEPIAARLRARGMGRGQAAITVTGLSVLIVLAIVGVTVWSMLGSLDELVDTSLLGAAKANVGDAFVDFIRSIDSDILAAVAGIVSATASLAVVLLLSVLLTFYLLKDGSGWWEALVRRTHGARRERLEVAGPNAAGILNGYMVGTGVISVFGAVTQWLIMVLLGLPLAVPIGVLSFFGGFIPYIGSAITTLLGFLVALAVGDTTDIVIMAVFTIVFNIVQGNFVAPLVYGKTVSLHPAIVLLAIPAGGAVAGILGMFLVVPFLGVLAVTWRAIIHTFDPDDPTTVAAGSRLDRPDVDPEPPSPAPAPA